MSISRKHYVSLAAVVRDNMYYLDDRTRRLVANDLAMWLLREDNINRFSTQRFIAACGVPVPMEGGDQ